MRLRSCVTSTIRFCRARPLTHLLTINIKADRAAKNGLYTFTNESIDLAFCRTRLKDMHMDNAKRLDHVEFERYLRSQRHSREHIDQIYRACCNKKFFLASDGYIGLAVS